MIGQHVPDLPRERLARVGLGQKLHPRIEPSAVHDGVLRVAGRKEDGDLRQPLLRFPRQLRAAQVTGHHHVGEDQIYRDAAIDDDECARRISRLFVTLAIWFRRRTERFRHKARGEQRASFGREQPNPKKLTILQQRQINELVRELRPEIVRYPKRSNERPNSDVHSLELRHEF